MNQPPTTETIKMAGSSVSVRTMIVCIRPERSAESMEPRSQMPVTDMSTYLS